MSCFFIVLLAGFVPFSAHSLYQLGISRIFLYLFPYALYVHCQGVVADIITAYIPYFVKQLLAGKYAVFVGQEYKKYPVFKCRKIYFPVVSVYNTFYSVNFYGPVMQQGGRFFVISNFIPFFRHCILNLYQLYKRDN